MNKLIVIFAYIFLSISIVNALEVATIKTELLQSKNHNLTNEEISYLKNKKKITMCVLPNWLPFEQIDKNGEHKGIGHDIMNIVSKYIDTPIVLLPTKTWLESLQNLRNRKCDILPVAMDIPSRRDSMNFTKPYVSEPFVIATKYHQPFVKNVESLSNKKIGIVKNYAFIEVLKSKNPSIDIVAVNTTKEGLLKVQSGELFGYVDTMASIGYTMQKYTMLDLKVAGKLEFDIKLSVASRNDEPLLHSIMEKSLNTISEDEIRSIVGRWITIKVSQEFDYKLLWQVSIVFFMILFIVIYKNRTVKIINDKLLLASKEKEEQQNMVNKYVPIATTDLYGAIIDANESYCKSVGYKKEELIGDGFSILGDPNTDPKVFKEMWKDIQNDKTWCGEVSNITKNGEVIWFYLNVEPIFNAGAKIGYRSINENITDKKIIEKLSITDQLTKLYNRHKLEDVFLTEMHRSKRYNHPLSMMMIDIDNFKDVNDTYGHDIGDQTLKELSKILKSCVRVTDIVGRWGGEEFIIIVTSTNLEKTKHFAQKIRRKIESFKFTGVGHITASFGVSTFEKDDTEDSFIKKADEALYKAKDNGRNRVEVYS